MGGLERGVNNEGSDLIQLFSRKYLVWLLFVSGVYIIYFKKNGHLIPGIWSDFIL